MKVTIYDKNPGPGLNQWVLKTFWLLGCWFQKLIGVVDAYYGASSWEDAKNWLKTRPSALKEIQYWGHGSPGTVWLGNNSIPKEEWLELKPYLAPNFLLWFRVCSSFKGQAGYNFSEYLANKLNCIVAGHTRVIGIWQGGLYTRAPNTVPSWDISEGSKTSWLREDFKFWNKHTIFCLKTSIPKGW